MADEQNPATVAEEVARKRPKPGERRIQILQALAAMLELPGAERITTAALAARLQVSEAALYRHFASKAQMFEGLIEFIETSMRYGSIILGGNMEWHAFLAKLNTKLWTNLSENQTCVVSAP